MSIREMTPDTPLVQGYRQWLERAVPDLPSPVAEAVFALLRAVEAGHDVVVIVSAMSGAAPWMDTMWEPSGVMTIPLGNAISRATSRT